MVVTGPAEMPIDMDQDADPERCEPAERGSYHSQAGPLGFAAA
jgi:hypothetical protein